MDYAVDMLDDDARPGYGHFVAFTPHVLQQYPEMQFAAAEDHEFVRIRRRFYAQRHIVYGLAVEAFADLPAGDEFAFAAEALRRINLERHADCRFVDGQTGQRLDIQGIA